MVFFFLSYGTHRYLIVHTWVGLKHSDTMEHTHKTERKRKGGREDTRRGGNGKNEKLLNQKKKKKKIQETKGN